MQARWGNYFFPTNGAEVTSQTSVAEATDWGMPLRYQVAYTVVVWLTGDTQAELSQLELGLRAALLRRNQDFALFTDAGAASSAAFYAKDSATGTKCVSISTPEAQGGEFVNRRTVQFVVVAEYHVADSENAIVSWVETVQIVGNGGPRKAWRYPINAPGIRQVISPTSPVRATQSGQAVGYLRRPVRPPPLWPDYLMNESDTKGTGAPRYMGPTGPPVDYPVTWSYTFERGDGPLTGVPRLPPGVI